MSRPRLPPDLKFGALVNPNSRGNRRRPPDLSRLRAQGLPVETPDSIDETRAALQRLADARVDVLAVSGGDGAVLATLTAVLVDGVFERPPALCVIAAGSTNMTAGDVGFRAGRDPLVRAAEVAASGGGAIVRRPAVRLDGAVGQDGAARPQAGMFFGAIAICRAIAACRRRWHARGLFGAPAHLLTLAPILFGRRATDGREGLLQGADAAVRIDGCGVGPELLDGPWSAVMATTLRRLTMGMRPFWGAGPLDVLDATFVRAPPPRVAANLPALLYGDRRRPREPGYVSRKASSIEMAYDGDVTLDGEIYRPAGDAPYRLSIAGEAAFLTSP